MKHRKVTYVTNPKPLQDCFQTSRNYLGFEAAFCSDNPKNLDTGHVCVLGSELCSEQPNPRKIFLDLTSSRGFWKTDLQKPRELFKGGIKVRREVGFASRSLYRAKTFPRRPSAKIHHRVLPVFISLTRAVFPLLVCFQFVCLFVGIKPGKQYSASCIGREVNPLGVITHGQRHKTCPY